MVVATGGWVKNVVTYPNVPQTNNDMVISTMMAKAVLICRPNSHPFQERSLTLDQPMKVGRSVGKTKAAPNNAIFDCKVLSRHHALLWYDCGKFYLQDMKSSNGTFVNNNRLPCNESESHEVSSGDIVQFGVDVVENNRKVTHGCIIATLKLYLPDGKEAKASPSITEGNEFGMVSVDELYKLNQVIQEAARREQCLESKLSALREYTDEVKTLVDYTWQVRIDEERLLSRVATLEKQLIQTAKKSGDEHLREEFSKLQVDKIAYQEAAKEALQKLHAEKLDAEVSATEKQRARETAEQEVDLARKLLTQAQSDLEDVAQRLSDEQRRANTEKSQFRERESELEAKLEEETRKIEELREKLEQMSELQLSDIKNEEAEKLEIIYNDDLKLKAELLEHEELSMNKANGAQEDENLSNSYPHGDCVKRVTFKTEENGSEVDDEKTDCDQTDTKTLKYQYQYELKKQVDHLEATIATNKMRLSEMENELMETKKMYQERMLMSDVLKNELLTLQLQLSETRNANKHLEAKRNGGNLGSDACVQTEFEAVDAGNNVNTTEVVGCPYTVEQLGELEEELVLVKEKYAVLAEEKTVLNRKLGALREQYNTLCNRSYNTMFFYIAPLVLMVLYLLISSITS